MRRRALRIRHGLALALALGVCACGARAEALRTDPATRRVDRAVQRGEVAATSLARIPAVVRHNPAPCACPEWELRAGTRWVRCDVWSSEEPAPDWLATPEPMREVRTSIRLSRDSVEGVDGWRYPVVYWVPDEE